MDLSRAWGLWSLTWLLSLGGLWPGPLLTWLHPWLFPDGSSGLSTTPSHWLLPTVNQAPQRLGVPRV